MKYRISVLTLFSVLNPSAADGPPSVSIESANLDAYNGWLPRKPFARY